MKKIIAIVLVFAAMFALAACGSDSSQETETPEVTVGSAEELLNTVWATIPEDQLFAAMGGDMNNMVDGSAAAFSLEDTENVLSFLHISAQSAAMADSAASLIHAMNANTFTSAAFHMAEGQDAEAFASAIRDEIMATQWICGFPEVLAVYILNDYVVYFLGNTQIVSGFRDGMTQSYGEAAVLAADESF